MISWEKIFKAIAILSGILTVGFLIFATWTTEEFSLKLGITGMILFFVTAITSAIWTLLYFND